MLRGSFVLEMLVEQAASNPGLTTLTDLLDTRRVTHPQIGYTYLENGRTPGEFLSFDELDQQARAIASRLAGNAAAGSRALLLFPTDRWFLPAFFGCLLAGIVAVPVPMPDLSRFRRSVPRLRAIAASASPTLILTTAAALAGLQERFADILPRLEWIAADTVPPGCNDAAFRPLRPDPGALAYLQYTSGSTASPRGVIITHANILANLRHLQTAFVYEQDSISVTWMPHYHDYGLVEGLLQPLYSGIPCYVLSPLAVLKRPLRWLQAISRFRATHSHGPNFAYELCLDERVPAEPELNLSCWRMAGNGAEPIRLRTLQGFARKFAALGFDIQAFFPAYGLAEATLFVTARRSGRDWTSCRIDAAGLQAHLAVPAGPDAPAEATRDIVSCGVPQGDARLLIVDPETRRPCPADGVGEIWLADRSVGRGYWNESSATEDVFSARLAGDPTAGPFLRTGDLGFLRGGELYVTGRLKDLVIIAGVNHYPQDIEWTVRASAPELRRDHCVAFAIDRGAGDELVIVAELEDRSAAWDDLFHRLRATIAEAHDIDPAAIVTVERGSIPKTSSGKLQRTACRQAFMEGRLSLVARWDSVTPAPVSTGTAVRLHDWLTGALASLLRLDPAEIKPDRPIAEYGITSRSAVELIERLEDRLGGRELSPTLLWEFPTIAELCSHLAGNGTAPKTRRIQRGVLGPKEPIAVVGLACRFPGAANPEAYWALLRGGGTALTRSSRLPGVTAGFLPEVAAFDNTFFGVSAAEAGAMDPQQRLLLEVAWEALEDAGLAGERRRDEQGGVFIGVSAADFGYRSFGRSGARGAICAYTGPGIALSIAANRLSYALDLTGPSLAIDTACSSALVAVHQACRSLRSGECSFALAGGANVLLSYEVQLALESAGMLSPTAMCHSFDAAADGYVRGEGCGLVVLKRASDAARDGDPVRAYIRGSAINQDGRSNGLTAPNPRAQVALIRAALADSGVEPGTIDFVEAHGTGTRLGDPIEIGALQEALGERRDGARCWIGAVKANIGHLEAAAGIAGLIKTVLALEHGEIPAHPTFDRANKLIRFDGTPFSIPRRCEAWPRVPEGRRPRAAVSSFGFGGSNAHLVLESATQAPASVAADPAEPWPFAIAAHSPSALRALASAHAERLEAEPVPAVRDYCGTLAVTRAALRFRFACIAADRATLAAGLRDFADGRPSVPGFAGEASEERPKITFLFSGQGAQYAGMARGLYAGEPVFRRELDACAAVLGDELGQPLLPLLFEDGTGLLDQTAYTQPVLFAVEYALAQSLRHFGIEPDAMLGHSIGEYVAACVAGVFGLEDALRLVVARGRLMQSLAPTGAMLAVAISEEALVDAIRGAGSDVAIAAVNAPRSCVVSGDRQAIQALQARFAASRIQTQLLAVSHAFHSPLMEPILPAFRELATRVQGAPPRLPVISNLDGTVMTAAPDADYWTRHLRSTVRFADGVATAARECGVMLEIGPRPVLTSLAARCTGERDVQCLPTLQAGREDLLSLREVLARLYVRGGGPDWDRFFADRQIRRVTGLPTYPFERQLFPLPPLPPVPSDSGAEIDDWARVPVWTPVDCPEQSALPTLILSDRGGTGERLAAALHARGQDCALSDDRLPALPAGQGRLQVVCLWPLDSPRLDPRGGESDSGAFIEPLAELVRGLQALGRNQNREIRLLLVTMGCPLLAEDSRRPGDPAPLQAMAWGLGRTVAREYPDWQVRIVDTDGSPSAIVGQLAAECRTGDQWRELCWRDRDRRALSLAPWTLPAAEPSEPGGVWLITGGLGEIGLIVAERLAAAGARKLVLVGRSGPSDRAAPRIDALRASGAQIEVRALDVSDFAAVAQLITGLAGSEPPLDGVVHAAGVIDDCIFAQLDATRLRRVVGPKAIGAWNLHLATRGVGLRHFVLFSSLAGLLGNAGQSGYAAANAFLDGLAALRRASDLPATSIAWGAWANARPNPEVRRRLDAAGIRAIEPARGLEAFVRALHVPVPVLAISPPAQTGPLYTAQEAEPAPAAGTASSALHDELASLVAPERASHLTRHVLDVAAAIVGGADGTLEPERGFFDQGLTSLNVIELRNRLQRDLDLAFPATLAFDHPSAALLSRELLRRLGLEPDAPAPASVPALGTNAPEPDGIAVIGMACRMPGGVTDLDQFWALLRDGIDAISPVPPDRWDGDAFYHPDPDHPGTIVTRYGGFVEGVSEFDPGFFGIAPREAQQMDPQQRILLETCLALFEHAGVPPRSLLGSQTGVFIGISTNDYVQRLARDPCAIDGYLGTGNALSLAANRLSYVFGLEGPSLSVDTACSSSLVAVHQAMQSVLGGESDLAIAGGVNLLLDPMISINHSRARMLAPDGRCKTFAAAADGYVRSEGCGLVLLRRLSAAREAGNRVLAVLRGSAVNQDGRSSGLTVPNGPAQQRVIRRALARAGLPPEAISYVEAHGTGTPLGDPIEAEALATVFGGAGRTLAVGSVKTNIGHLEAAAGIAGLIKVVLGLQHAQIPAHLHWAEPTAHINWSSSPLRVPSATAPWTAAPGTQRRAGVSSFGFGGTNAHVILEEAPRQPPRDIIRPERYVLPLSAKSESALKELAQRVSDYLLSTNEDIADICFTAACGRDHYRHRLAVTGRGRSELQSALSAWLAGAPVAPPCAGEADGPEGYAARFLSGEDPDWTAFYAGLPLRRLSMPGHPLQRQTLLVDPLPPPGSPARMVELHWSPVPAAAAEAGTGRWLVLAGHPMLAEALSARLAARGRRTEIVLHDPAAPEALAALRDPQHAWEGVLWVGAPNAPVEDHSPDTLETALRHTLLPPLRLAQALRPPSRLWIATEQAVFVEAPDRVAGLLQTPLWGFGRSLALERPEIFGGVIDLGDAEGPEDLDAMAALLCAPRSESQHAVRNGRRFAPRLRRVKTSRRQVRIRADASYLLTGGFGAIGQAMARSLVRAGARHLWMIGRRGAERAGALVRELERDATVCSAAIDVGDAAALAAQIAAWRRTGPELRGIVHAAGTSARTPLAELGWEDVAAVARAKVWGTWALAQVAAGQALDFFVCCSSIASLWGGQEQAAYAAANAFLDGFACWRAARGLPATSIALGPVYGTEMVTDETAAELERMGLHRLSVHRLGPALLELADGGMPQVGLVAADFPRFAALHGAWAPGGLFSEVLEEVPRPAAPPQAVPAALDGVDAIRSWLAAELASVLQLPASSIEPQTPLLQLGLDSLTALDLRNRLQHRLNIALPMPELLAARGIGPLAEWIGSLSGRGGSAPAEADSRTWIVGEI